MLELVESATIDGVLIYELSQVARTFWGTLDTIKPPKFIHHLFRVIMWIVSPANERCQEG